MIEIFESPKAASRFPEERFAPALAALGFTGQPPRPQLWPVHAWLAADSEVSGA